MSFRSRSLTVILCAVLGGGVTPGATRKPKKAAEPSALDKYIQEAMGHAPPVPMQASTGSLWTPASRLTDLGGDLRAAQVNDLVTVVVNEQASAVAAGNTKTSRVSSLQSSISSLFGPKSATSALSNLANANNDTELNGQGATSRSATLNTTLSARVTHVLPNGYLVLEGTKNVQVNSEHQIVTVRGIIRPIDLSPGNVITSNQLAQLEIKIDGKGVINDAAHRPNVLYRLLLGLLPF